MRQCYSPKQLFLYEIGGTTKWLPKIKGNDNYLKMIEVDCEKCIRCRLNKSLEDTLKAVTELKTMKKAIFITLTFREEVEEIWEFKEPPNERYLETLQDILPNRELEHKPFSLFMKRLRSRLKNHFKENEPKIKFLMCGEYGPTTGRAHYHAIIFGIDENDLKALDDNQQKITRGKKSGRELYTYKALEDIWGWGRTTLDVANQLNIQYISKYNMKTRNTGQKFTPFDNDGNLILDKNGIEIKGYYYDEELGRDRKPEYVRMSTQNGCLGKDWLEDNYKSLLLLGYAQMTVLSTKSKKQREDTNLNKRKKHTLKLRIPEAWLDWIKENHYEDYLDYKQRCREQVANMKEMSPEELKQLREMSRIKAELQMEKAQRRDEDELDEE